MLTQRFATDTKKRMSRLNINFNFMDSKLLIGELTREQMKAIRGGGINCLIRCNIKVGNGFPTRVVVLVHQSGNVSNTVVKIV
jgi:hypothetical protein